MPVERVPIPFTSGFYVSRSLPLDAQNCINWLPLLPEPQDTALSVQALIGAQGVYQFCNVESDYPTRGSQQMGDKAYYVNGNYLFLINADKTFKNLGYISGSGPVYMANNNVLLVIVVPGDKGYVYDSEHDTLLPITDENWVPATTVVFIDGYFVYTATDGSKFFISELNQPGVLDPLGFGSIPPDLIIAAYVSHNELFILGEDTIVIYQNVGGDSFPFQRIPGGIIQKGLFAAGGVAYLDNTFLFLGGGLNEKVAIWKVAGSSTAQKMSTDAIDYALQQYTTQEISAAIGLSYSDNGHFCAGFTIFSSRFGIPSTTFIYDVTSSMLAGKQVWHQRQSGISANCWRINNIIEAYGLLFCGDNTDGRIGILDSDTYTEYGDPIFRQKTSAPFANLGKAQFFGDIEITAETGVGNAASVNPQLYLSYSNDGGRTFASQSPRSMGAQGQYNTRCIWRRQGYFPRSRMLRLTCSEPVKANILKAECWSEGGSQ